jgi:uncharacterized OB-fold protein
MAQPALVVGADLAVHPAGSAAEARCGDGAGAAVVGCGTPVLIFRGGLSTTTPFVDRYQAPGLPTVDWEERWVREEGVLAHVPEAIAQALGRAGLAASEIDHVVLPSTIPGVSKAVVERAGLTRARLAPDFGEETGDTGSGHALVMIAGALDRMAAGQTLLVAQFGQGVTVLVFEATEMVGSYRTNLDGQLAAGIAEETYLKLPVFRGQLGWDRGLRGRQSTPEALTTAYRKADPLLGFVAGRCRETGQVQFPPSRLVSDGSGLFLDTQEPWPLADRLGTVTTATADRLAFSRSPPSCYGLVDFDGGGRLMMDFTDPDADTLTTGQRVRFALRIKDLDDRTGWRRYFWKAAALVEGPSVAAN